MRATNPASTTCTSIQGFDWNYRRKVFRNNHSKINGIDPFTSWRSSLRRLFIDA